MLPFTQLAIMKLIFLSFYISTAFVHCIHRQPSFFTPNTIWKISNDYSSSISPFYKNEQELAFQIQYFINKGEGEKALELLKAVVKIERTWRLQMCIRIFGKKACKDNDSTSVFPFYMWKKRIIHNLNLNPTDEIIERIRKTVKFSN